MTQLLEEIKKLGVAQRIQIIEDIWKSVEEDIENLEADEIKKRGFQKCVEKYRRESNARAWATVSEEFFGAI